MAIWEDPGLLSGTVLPMTSGGDVKPEVGICVIYGSNVEMAWAIRTAHVFMHLQNIKKPFIYLLNHSQPYDTAREIITRRALEIGCKYVFHYDSDVLIPINTIEVLIQWMEKFDVPILSGLYWAKKPAPPQIPAAWLKMSENKEENLVHFAPVDVKDYGKTNSIVKVDVTGAGCLLIRKDVFEKLDKSNPDLPYFQWGLGRNYLCPKCGAKGPLPKMSEDFYFCQRTINELGIHPHVAFGVKCDHITTGVKRGEDGEFELTLKV